MAPPGNLYALSIGINDYERAAVGKLNFAVADVMAFRDFLGQRTGIDPLKCVVLSSPAERRGAVPRRADVIDALDRFTAAPMGPDDTFLLYFAGHGFAQDGKTYLLAVDSNPSTAKTLEATAISLDMLENFAQDIKAGQMFFILDACRNAPAALGRGAESARLDAAMARDIVALARSKPGPESGPARQARAILSACWEGQVSYEYPAQRHGLEVASPEFKTFTTKFAVSPGATLVVRVMLEPKARPAPPAAPAAQAQESPQTQESPAPNPAKARNPTPQAQETLVPN